MKPAPFQYHAPQTLEEALRLLAEHRDEAKLLAGGQSLVPVMNFRLAEPRLLIDLNRTAGLDHLEPGDDGGLRLGAMVRQRAAERSPRVWERCPLLAQALPWVGHVQTRNRGTVGGSLAHAEPAAELPAVMLALAARFRLCRQGGERWLGARDFFTGLFATALEPDEILVEVEVPSLPPRTGCAFGEFARRHGDFALAGVAATVTLAEDGSCSDARVALLGVGEGPVWAEGAVRCLRGESPTAKVLAEAAERAAHEDCDPGSDVHASAPYRRHLVRVLTEEALAKALERTS